MKTLNETYTMHNGVKIPKIGFGTWQIPPGEQTYRAVSLALKHGYRHIDTAAAYKNEESVGEAIRDSGIDRHEIFVTSKLPATIKSYNGALAAFEETMEKLGLDVLDLYLIHAPRPWGKSEGNYDEGNRDAFLAMEKLYKEGRIRAIGVSNFSPSDIENILKECTIVPHANQIAYFVGIDQKKTHDYCREKDILVEAYSPLAIGKALKNPDVIEMAGRYDVTPAQLLIRFCLQKGTVPLPKSVHEDRIIENTKVDFEINDTDMMFLDTIEDDPRKD